MTTSSVLTKVSRAIERGTLSKQISVEVTGGRVRLFVPRGWNHAQTIEASEQLLRWVERNFPGGTLQNRRWSHSHTPYRSRATTYWDAITYAHSKLHATVLAPHEHESFMTVVSRRDLKPGELPQPTWTCAQCRKPIKVLEARRLGLAIK